MSPSISLDTAAIVTELSKRTWQRRLANGDVKRLPDDTRGRSMISLIDIQPLICIPMNEEEVELLISADSGAAISQSDIGQLFAVSGKNEVAVYWFKQAAEQNNADAMQWLGIAYASGKGVAKDEHLALMWIAKSASLGHEIAKNQIKTLKNFSAIVD